MNSGLNLRLEVTKGLHSTIATRKITDRNFFSEKYLEIGNGLRNRKIFVLELFGSVTGIKSVIF